MSAITTLICLLGLNLFYDPNINSGFATTFGPSLVDEGNPDDSLACSGQVKGSPLRLGENTLAVASYNLSCGTWLEIINPKTGKIIRAQVLDRGPRRTKNGAFPYDLDLSTSVGKALGVDGRTCYWKRGRGCYIFWRIVRPPPSDL